MLVNGFIMNLVQKQKNIVEWLIVFVLLVLKSKTPGCGCKRPVQSNSEHGTSPTLFGLNKIHAFQIMHSVFNPYAHRWAINKVDLILATTDGLMMLRMIGPYIGIKYRIDQKLATYRPWIDRLHKPQTAYHGSTMIDFRSTLYRPWIATRPRTATYRSVRSWHRPAPALLLLERRASAHLGWGCSVVVRSA